MTSITLPWREANAPPAACLAAPAAPSVVKALAAREGSRAPKGAGCLRGTPVTRLAIGASERRSSCATAATRRAQALLLTPPCDRRRAASRRSTAVLVGPRAALFVEC